MEDDILIDNYLKGLLSKDEEKSFIDRLESDHEFKQKFSLEKQLNQALDDQNWSFVNSDSQEVKDYKYLLEEDDLQNLKKTLAKTNSDFNSKNKGTRHLFYYIAAASILVFLGLQFFLNQNVTNQELYAEYIDLNKLPSFVSRSDGNDDLAKAQKLFEEGKYNDALSIFESQIDNNNNKANKLIYVGISQTQLGKFDKAEKTFDTLIGSGLIDSEKGYWYKALLYLKQDKKEESKAILNRIISKSLFNYEKAKELLSEL